MSVLFLALGLALVTAAVGFALLGVGGSRKGGTRRYLILLASVLLASVPLSVLVTFLLVPFWRWMEATYGIESIGHSGPAAWCYLAAFLACSTVLGCAGVLMAKRRLREETA